MNIYYQNKYIGAIGGVIEKKKAQAFLSELIEEEINPDLIQLQCENFEQVRIYREPLLAEADHLINMAQDINADTTTYRAYRQALRDITSAYSDAKTVKWPEKPMLD